MQENKPRPIDVTDVSNFLKNKLKINIFNDENQKKYVENLICPTTQTQAVFCNSPAGTGKTSIAVATAYFLLDRNYIDQIIYVRNAISIREQGFLPGDIAEKEAPYMQSGLDVLGKIKSKNKSGDSLIESLINKKQLIVSSTSFLRGIDWSGNKMLIIDEAQNLNLNELQTTLTRPHDSVKVVVIGSSRQCDCNLVINNELFRGMIPFEVYIKYFMNQDTIPIQVIKLNKNYRGKFSNYADDIQNFFNKR